MTPSCYYKSSENRAQRAPDLQMNCIDLTKWWYVGFIVSSINRKSAFLANKIILFFANIVLGNDLRETRVLTSDYVTQFSADFD